MPFYLPYEQKLDAIIQLLKELQVSQADILAAIQGLSTTLQTDFGELDTQNTNLQGAVTAIASALAGQTDPAVLQALQTLQGIAGQVDSATTALGATVQSAQALVPPATPPAQPTP